MKSLAGKFILALAFFGLPHAPARACDDLKEDNQRVSKEIDKLDSSLTQLRLLVTTTEAACQAAQSTIATKGAASATAESCVALKEASEMNRQLTEKSVACAQSVTELRERFDELREKYIEPEWASVEGILEADKDASETLGDLCGEEMKEARVFRERAERLVGNVRTSVAHASEDIKNYSSLAEKTQAMMQTTADGMKRCGLEVPSLPLAGGMHSPSFGRGAGVPTGKAFHQASRVTGDLSHPNLNSGTGTAGVNAPGAVAITDGGATASLARSSATQMSQASAEGAARAAAANGAKGATGASAMPASNARVDLANAFSGSLNSGAYQGAAGREPASSVAERQVLSEEKVSRSTLAEFFQENTAPKREDLRVEETVAPLSGASAEDEGLTLFERVHRRIGQRMVPASP